MWFEFVLGSLAIWRISHLVAHEDGPFEIFYKLRMRAGAVWANDEWFSEKVLGALLLCPLCLSIWFSIPVALYFQWGSWSDILLWWLALSGAASALELIAFRGEK